MSGNEPIKFCSGMVVCPETAQTSLIDLSFACSIVKSYGFGSFGVIQEVFQAESDPKMRGSDA